MKFIIVLLVFILSCSALQAHGHDHAHSQNSKKEQPSFLSDVWNHATDVPHHVGHFISDYVFGPVVAGVFLRFGFNGLTALQNFGAGSGCTHGHERGHLSSDEIKALAAAVAAAIDAKNK